MNEYRQTAEAIIAAVGGKENIAAATHCATRLRMVLKDENKIDKAAIDTVPLAKGNFLTAGQFQIILGTGTVNKVTAELPDKKVTVEIKSLNSKQLDLSVRIPAVYREREMQLRNELLQRLERGKVDLNINVEYIGRDTSARINAAAVTGYYEQIHELAGRLGVPEPTDWFTTLLRLPETVRSEAGEVSEAEWQAVHDAVSEAVTRLIDFRTQEGAMLRRVFEQKIGIIGDLLREVEPYEQERVEKIRGRLTENLKKNNATLRLCKIISVKHNKLLLRNTKRKAKPS